MCVLFVCLLLIINFFWFLLIGINKLIVLIFVYSCLFNFCIFIKLCVSLKIFDEIVELFFWIVCVIGKMVLL